MGCDWWSVTTYTGYGIVVSVDDVKASYAASRSATDTEENTSDNNKNNNNKSSENFWGGHEDVPPPPVPLSDKVKLWMIEQADGFAMHIIFDCFVIITYESERLSYAKEMELCGPYTIEPQDHGMYFVVKSGGPQFLDSDLEFVQIAQALTPTGMKLSYPPGTICLTTTVDLQCETITHKSYVQTRAAQLFWFQAQGEEGSIPSNLTFIIGTGEEEQQYFLNRAALSFYVPVVDVLINSQKEGFTNSSDDNNSKSSVVLKFPSLSPDAFESVLRCLIDYGRVPKRPTEAEKLVIDAFGLAENDMNTDKVGSKQKITQSQEDMSRTHNVTFLVGPDETPVTAQREVLAAANPVLCRMLYGLDQSNPNMPDSIKWPDFDVVAVERVLAALVHCKAATYAPYDCRQLVLSVLDYLGESESSVSMEYNELPWIGNCASIDCLIRNDRKQNEGLYQFQMVSLLLIFIFTLYPVGLEHPCLVG